MKHYISIIILAIFLFSCNGHSKHWETLSQVESYIEEKPDSALVTLEQIDLSELSGKEEKAKYALLYSMALDKNFIDKTDFELLQPAIDYYEDNGSATDKLRTCYYQGRIYQNLGNDALAMESFVKAISEGDASDDVLTVIVKTCSDSLFSIGQKNCQLFVAKLRNFLDSHNRMVLY